MENTAKSRKWYLTPDKEIIGYLTDGFQINIERYGYLQCPCRDSWGDRKKDSDILCPCTYARADIEEWGQCYCGLFLDKNVHEKGGAEGSIPERRAEDHFPE